MMPKRLLFVRHAESEGNVANDLIEAGKKDELPDGVFNVPSWRWRLTAEGRSQARQTGFFLRQRFAFDPLSQGFASCYIRTAETVGYLDLPNLKWRFNYYIRERDFGELEYLPQEDRGDAYLQARTQRKQDQTFWTPPSGESIAGGLIRADRLFDTLHRECTDDNVIVVTHGGTMWMYRLLLRKLLPWEFQALTEDPTAKINNCQIDEYTRIDPKTGAITDKIAWTKSYCPWKNDFSMDWLPIKRKLYSPWEMLDIANLFPTFF